MESILYQHFKYPFPIPTKYGVLFKKNKNKTNTHVWLRYRRLEWYYPAPVCKQSVIVAFSFNQRFPKDRSHIQKINKMQVLTCEWRFYCPKWSHFSWPEHTPILTKLGIYITAAEKYHNLLSPSISTTRWHYNQRKCILAYNSHILCCTFKNVIFTHSLNCIESGDTADGHFCQPFLSTNFAQNTKCPHCLPIGLSQWHETQVTTSPWATKAQWKNDKLTFSNSS